MINKYFTKIFIASCIILLSMMQPARSQYVTLPDTIFRNYLQTIVPSCFNGAGQLDTTCLDLYLIDSISVSNMGITDLTGIQYCWPMRVNCSHNLLTSLPSMNGYSLNCSYNYLTQLTAPGGDLNCSH